MKRVEWLIDDDLKRVTLTLDGETLTELGVDELRTICSGVEDMIHDLRPLEQQDIQSIIQNAMYSQPGALTLVAVYRRDNPKHYAIRFYHERRSVPDEEGDWVITNWGEFKKMQSDLSRLGR